MMMFACFLITASNGRHDRPTPTPAADVNFVTDAETLGSLIMLHN